jgi:hypothetical protein
MYDQSIIYILYYDDNSKIIAENEFKAYKQTKLFFNRTDKYLENNFYLDFPERTDWHYKKYVGCLSYKFHRKVLYDNKVADVNQILLQYNNLDIDGIGFLSCDLALKQDESHHPGLLPMITTLLKRTLNIDISSEYDKFKVFYCNYWILKTELMLKYSIFLSNIIRKIDSDPALKELFDTDAQYSGKYVTPVDTMIKMFGKPYYTWYPFVLERLPSIFCYLYNIKIVNHIGAFRF